MGKRDVKVPLEAGKRELRRVTKRDAIAGVTVGIANVPDAMANAVLAGLNPIQGLYAIMVGTPAASLATGSQVMTVAVTGAMALVVGDSLSGVAASEQLEALLVLTLLVALVQIALGLARAASFLRFVSNAVLRGFMTGVAVNIVLSQVPAITGYDSAAGNKVSRAFDTALNLGLIDLRVLTIGLITIGVVLLAERTRARELAFLLALLATTVGVSLLGWQVPTVRSLSEIPSVLPSASLPRLSLVVGLVVPAVSIAIVGLIQGAGVSKGIPNRDGTYPDLNRDFIGQGVGNAFAGLFGGMPVGGSVSSSSLVVQLGARSRVANFIVGPLVAAIVLLFSSAVEAIPLSTLAALLVIVGVRAVDVGAVQTVWQTSVPARTIMVVTFVAMLLMPVQYAVLLGVALSVVQHVYSASLDVRVVMLERLADGTYAEKAAPPVLPDESVTVLDIYGSVFYAGADVIARLLPTAKGSRRPAVILRLRGRSDVGSTFLVLLERYRKEIQAAGGVLMLAGVGPELRSQLERTGVLAAIGEANVCEAQATLTASVSYAMGVAEAWLHEAAA